MNMANLIDLFNKPSLENEIDYNVLYYQISPMIINTDGSYAWFPYKKYINNRKQESEPNILYGIYKVTTNAHILMGYCDTNSMASEALYKYLNCYGSVVMDDSFLIYPDKETMSVKTTLNKGDSNQVTIMHHMVIEGAL